MVFQFQEEFENFIFVNRRSISFLLIGLVLFGIGVFLFRSGIFDETEIEVVKEKQDEPSEIVVEVSGAVENPGVFRLNPNARVEDALIAAGGLGQNADRDWVAKNINRAQKLLDGQKLYIPKLEESAQIFSQTSKSSPVLGSTSSLVNINTASEAELDTLWGIGKARAAAIIKGRPYSSVAELLTRKIIPKSVYERIKDRITAP